MFARRYEPDVGCPNDSERNNFKQFFKKVKKRRLKHQTEGSNLSSKRKKQEQKKSDNLDVEDPLNNSVNKKDISESITIIGDYNFTKTTKVKPVLPKWLSHPELISNDLTQGSCQIKEIDCNIISNLEKNKITKFFPVQQAVIPWVVKQSKKVNSPSCRYVSRDVCVSSPTGSGKTLAYVLPIVQGLLNRLVPRIRCLVVVPVQELAEQVANVFINCVKGTSLRVMAITGGKLPLQIEQDKLLKKIKGIEEPYEVAVDIVVITPGRLVEHLQKTEGFNLKHLLYLVIDEADRMLDGIQNDWLFYLEKHLDQGSFSTLTLSCLRKKRIIFQKLLFSATLSQDPEKLQKLKLFQPVLFTPTDEPIMQILPSKDGQEVKSESVGKFMMPRELEEFYIVVENYEKPVVIAELLLSSSYRWRMVLCFCKSSTEARKLSNLMSIMCPTLKIKDISSLLCRKTRNKVLSQFGNGEIDMLVCTDVMARGIDIPAVRYVISYDPPKYLRGYVHRAGRTGRAGMKGIVLTLTTPTQVSSLTQKLKEVNGWTNIIEMKMDENILVKRSKDFKVALKKLQSQPMLFRKPRTAEKKL